VGFVLKGGEEDDAKTIFNLEVTQKSSKQTLQSVHLGIQVSGISIF